MQQGPFPSVGETLAVTAHIKPSTPSHQTSHHTSNFPPPHRHSMSSGNLSTTERELRLSKDLRAKSESAKGHVTQSIEYQK